MSQTDWGLYAGTRRGGVFRLNTKTNDWESLGLSSASIRSIVFVPRTPSRLLVGLDAQEVFQTTEAAIYATGDSGRTWFASDGGMAAANGGMLWAPSLAVDPRQPHRLFWHLGFVILRSDDAGLTWDFVLGDLKDLGGDAPSIVASADVAGQVFAAVGSPLGTFLVYRSTDGGDTWDFVIPFPRAEIPIYSLALDPLRQTLWAGMDGLVARSDDKGETWQVEEVNVGIVSALVLLRGDLLAVELVPDLDKGCGKGQFNGLLALHRLQGGAEEWDEIAVPPGICGALSATVDSLARLVIGTAGSGVWRWSP
ncbi:MAG: WD40/YVTN/BNR-like repeat-containing protein [Gemmatimonadales bacterium]